MDKQPQRKEELSEDDRIRMSRLYEEIGGRLLELNLIASRVLGKVIETGCVQIGEAEAAPRGLKPKRRVTWISNEDGEIVGYYDYSSCQCVAF